MVITFLETATASMDQEGMKMHPHRLEVFLQAKYINETSNEILKNFWGYPQPPSISKLNIICNTVVKSQYKNNCGSFYYRPKLLLSFYFLSIWQTTTNENESNHKYLLKLVRKQTNCQKFPVLSHRTHITWEEDLPPKTLPREVPGEYFWIRGWQYNHAQLTI